MCKAYYDAEKGYCADECPAHDIQCTDLDDLTAEAEELVRATEAWSAAHPRKTRQSVFLEQWPSVRIDKDIDVLNICPADLDERYRDVRGRCNIRSTQTGACDCCRREFWMQEVE